MPDFLARILGLFQKEGPTITLFNARTRSEEKFIPLSPTSVSMYHCGPTVYDDSHIGNLRSYFFADILRRVMEWNGYTVTQVVNVTDVGHLGSNGDEGEDKMTKAVRRLGKPLTLESMREVGTIYFEKFQKDLQEMNVETPQYFPRASDYIEEMVQLIKKLESRGYAYKISDGVYFDTSAFGRYGALPGSAPGGLHRVGENREKRNPRDFALWKLNADLGWQSPWGKGFPGWHIECSAMGMKILGETFDIHTGGSDLAPIHHNNEIAQSEAATGKPFARYWLHHAFLNMGGEKMAKSAGQFLRLSELVEKGYSPMDLRYLFLNAHYRTPIDFSIKALNSAKDARRRLVQNISELPSGGTPSPDWLSRFEKNINNDLATPSALATLHEMLVSSLSPADKRATANKMDKVLGLRLLESEKEEVPEEIVALAKKAESARKKKDFATSDAIRKEIENKGYSIENTSKGPKIRPL